MAAQKLTYQSEGTPEIFWTVFKNGQAQKIFFTPKNRVNYYPYGKILRQFVGVDEKFLSTQHERDAETGLDYRGARFYDSDIARFLSLDPLAMDFTAWSSYNYVISNPILLIDPNGKEPIEPQSGGLTDLIKLLFDRKVYNASSFHHKTGSNWFKGLYNDDKFEDGDPRYVYSTQVGWIDIKHFAGGAYFTSLFGSTSAILWGEGQELDQSDLGYPSAYSYEDLTSNLFGIYFQAVYLKSDEAQGLSYLENLNNFLKEIGVVEDPTDSAPNEASASHDAKDDSGIKSYTYAPTNNTGKRGELVNKVYDWLGEQKNIDENSNRQESTRERRRILRKARREFNTRPKRGGLD